MDEPPTEAELMKRIDANHRELLAARTDDEYFAILLRQTRELGPVSEDELVPADEALAQLDRDIARWSAGDPPARIPDRAPTPDGATADDLG
jgi:hypothetical protein